MQCCAPVDDILDVEVATEGQCKHYHPGLFKKIGKDRVTTLCSDFSDYTGQEREHVNIPLNMFHTNIPSTLM